jgi:hypothetical protein
VAGCECGLAAPINKTDTAAANAMKSDEPGYVIVLRDRLNEIRRDNLPF